ncbi:hypothetical protein [Fimbriiglobus ruber]|uniref:PH domain-containing protein n=1 Tax=Fimbriiglobus ruber TaxID=1908690 RepID=A0A225E1R2_9BACT|nr:hypothetical protein [Fimbriiglobus ruber]OWK45724.1 hypothetical protein FRUB_02055 [Fimbriiglobus ruber]
MEEPSELVLRPGLSRFGWLFGSAAALAALGDVMLYRGTGLPWLYLGLAALLTGFGCWVLTAPRMWLRLSPTGFEYGTVLRRYSFRWDDVAWFGVSEFASHRWVVFVFAREYPGDERVRRINQRFGGFDRILPDTYGYRPVALAELLESWRFRHTRQSEPGTTAPDGGA